MAKVLQLETTQETTAEPRQLPLVAENNGEKLTFAQLLAAAAEAAGSDAKSCTLKYTDSDGDEVTITSDADLKELQEYMEDEQLDALTVTVVAAAAPASSRAANAVQTQLRGLVTAMSKLTAKNKSKPTPANAMNLLVASLETMDVAEEATELAAVKKDMVAVLEDDEFRGVIEELCASDEFKELAEAMVTAIYEEDAQAIEDTLTTHFDELLVFAQRVLARCPSLKPVLVGVAKACMTGIVRYNDAVLVGDNSDASSSSSSSSSCDSCSDDQETVDVDDLNDQGESVHLGIICDGCEKAPLVGVRYKSLDVPNFDLCEECEASGKWVSHEPFIKITDPSRAPKQKRRTEMHPFVSCDGCEMTPIVGPRFKSQTADDFDLCESCEASGKWNETHGPFMRIEEPGVMRGWKMACRRGEGMCGAFERGAMFGHHGHHGKFGHHGHHGHHGKFGHHGHHGKFGRHGHHGKFGHGPPPHCHGPPEFRGEGPPHHHHGPPPHCHGPPEFRGEGPPHHHGPPPFPGFGPPPHHHGPPEFRGDGPPGFPGHGPPPHHHGPPEFHGRGPPPCCRGRGPPGFGPPGFEFGPPCPVFMHGGRPPCPPEFERPGRHGHHGCHGRRGRHTRFSEGEEQQEKKKEEKEDDKCRRGPRGRHGHCGRGRWCSPGTSDLDARFIEDVSIEDGTVLEATKPLRKMWKLVNDGERAWPAGCYMAVQRGNPMLVQDGEESRIELPPLAVGEEFIAGVDLVAPALPGRYTSYWRVCDPAGVSFGHRFWIDIVVAAGSTALVNEDTEMADMPEAIVCGEASSEEDLEIIEVTEAQEAEAAHKTEIETEQQDAEEDKADYEEALKTLAAMGFNDADKNVQALTASSGNVDGAVNALLAE